MSAHGHQEPGTNLLFFGRIHADKGCTEAMACGTPVMAGGCGSVAEIIRHGETGLIVQYSDEAVAALSRLRGLDRARIRQHVADRFSQARMVDHYINVYEEV